MTSSGRWRTALLELDPSEWPEFLDEHSGLPGPRGNLELAGEFAALAAPETIQALLDSGDEYRMFCGAVALGACAADPAVAQRLRSLATDERWRVREGVAIGLQRLGDVDADALHAIVGEWADDADPLVQRAAAAAICEPRLLRTPTRAAVAIDVCRRTTANLARRPRAQRRDPSLRVLRQALGYCWSVAIAADPAPGLRAFHDLDDSDPDIAWVVAQNLKKKRLTRLI